MRDDERREKVANNEFEGRCYGYDVTISIETALFKYTLIITIINTTMQLNLVFATSWEPREERG